MEDWYKKWLKSKKLLLFQEELNKKRMAQSNMKEQSREELIEVYKSHSITQAELSAQCISMIYDNSQPTSEEKMYWEFYNKTFDKTKKELKRDFINKMRHLYAFMAIYQEKEAYELCQLLLDCVKIVKSDYMYSVITFFEFDVMDEAESDYVDDYYKKLFLDY